MRKTLIAICILLTGATAMAQATQPAQGPGRRGFMPGGPGRGTRGNPQEIERAINWAQQNMPNLANLARQTPRGGGRLVPLTNIVLRNMRAIEQSPPDSPMRENLIKIAKAEDDMIPLLIEARQAAADAKPAVRERMHKQMRQIVDSALADRSERIARLRARLEAEERQLEQDRQNVDQIVIRRLEAFRNAETIGADAPPVEPANAMEPTPGQQ